MDGKYNKICHFFEVASVDINFNCLICGSSPALIDRTIYSFVDLVNLELLYVRKVSLARMFSLVFILSTIRASIILSQTVSLSEALLFRYSSVCVFVSSYLEFVVIVSMGCFRISKI